jgi:sulfite reductase (NADPH) flavoprotein alpha-component
MNQPLRPPIATILPSNAPFTPEQHEWLNGFFAGLLEGDVAALSPQQAAHLMPDLDIGGAPAATDDGEAPWHDQSLPLADRMKLAEGRPLRRRMMAAMGQQDCGQCGFNCQDYADAIFTKKEERLNLCVPGGKETARMLKTLYAEIDTAPAVAPSPATAKAPETSSPAHAQPAGTTRDNPVLATFVARNRLNKNGSAKETWHLEFDLSESKLEYTAGDSFGLLPINDPSLVDAILKALGAPADFPIAGRALRDVLLDSVSLSPAPDMLFQLFSYISGGDRRQKAKALGAGGDPDGDAATLDVLAAIEKFSGIRPDPEAFIEALDPLAPRLYSISSSPKVHKRRLSLTVDTVRYDIGKRTRLGVASTFLANRLKPGDKVKVYIQKAQHFGLPADPAVPMIMIGPGTGIAPFRAFLYERMATKAPGENWLFFGHQHYDYDFFYADELSGLKAVGVLTHLFLAWSRDDTEKFYVQDRMRQVGSQLWQCIAKGAHVYVCGAIAMGQDVERALVDIVAQFGARSTNEAVAFVKELRKSGRYQTDVY